MTISTRRRITCACAVISFAVLVALAVFPPLRHRALGGGWSIAASAAVSILACVYYLHSTRSRS
jgi:hypothetical protein